MDLKNYFENTKGLGVLATADSEGKVDVAVYARPHVLDDTHVAFIMSDRLSHANLQSNGQAAYMFIEEGGGYQGKRLYLTKVSEETDTVKIAEVRRKQRKQSKPEDDKFLVTFSVNTILPAVGNNEE